MPNTLRVGLLLYPGCMPAGLLAFADLLNATNRRVGAALFETRLLGLSAGAVSCANGVSLDAGDSLDAADVHAVLVPGFWAESAAHVTDTITANRALISTLSTQARQSALWSYCTGVCFLAGSGRLDGQAATVTWWLADAMARAYTKMDWRTERECVFNERTATASGVNGYLPIAQALIEKRVSPAVFDDLIKLMVLPRPVQTHKAFQAVSLIQQPRGLMRSLHLLIEDTPAEQVTVEHLAAGLGTSERTLARRTRDETGLTAAEYARLVKLNQVSERLILTARPVTTISAELGFSSESNLRRAFKRTTGFTPVEYRQRYGRS